MRNGRMMNLIKFVGVYFVCLSYVCGHIKAQVFSSSLPRVAAGASGDSLLSPLILYLCTSRARLLCAD